MLQRLFKWGKTSTGQTAQLGREFKVGDVVEQRFEVEQVRRGYMGIVYISYDRQRRQRVVLKTFQNKFLWDDQAIARFNAEAELWIRLGSHANIVRAYDLRTFLGKPHVVAEYVHGGPVRALVGHLKLQEAIDYAIQVCWGMTHAVEHAAIMHRDLKPDNIMVTLDGQVKVTDFGLARVLPIWQWAEHLRSAHSQASRMRAQTAPDVLGGTLPYMAPELLQESPYIGTWTDIYAFGVMLYEFFTGKLPFDSMRDESLVRMHLKVAPPDPRKFKPQLDEEIGRVVLRCLEKRPFERFQNFREVEAELQALRERLFQRHYTVVWPAGDSAEREHLTERGLAHMELGEYSEALSSFRQALMLDKNRPDGWLNLARARLKLWQYNEALQAAEEGLQRAVSRNEFGQLYGICGETYAAMLMPEQAMEAYDKGLSYTPSAPSLWRQRGVLWQRMGILREARQCLERALSFDKLDSLSWRLLGDVLYEEERSKKAYKAYTESLKLDPRSAVGWARYGTCQLKLARAKSALRSFEMALKLDPDLEEALAGLRTARQILGK
jgi:eukaryotic-like serine/threonine-protein kinase